jgi:ribose transport system substrate-binding protein
MRIASKSWASLPALAASLLCACGGRHASTETYILVAANTRIAYWREAAQGLESAAREMGVQWAMVGPEKYDPKGEREEFLAALHRQIKPAGILVSAADPKLMQDAIDSAVTAGIPVITIDSDSPKSKRLTFIGTNNYQAGQTGAEILVSQLKGQGNIVVYTMPGQANLDDRLEGYKRVLARSPKIKILQVFDVAGEPSKAFDTTEALVEKSKTLPDGFVCLEALSCAEVADVLDRHGIRGKTIIAMDTAPDTMQWIQKGMITATIAQRPFTMAYFGTRVLDDFHHTRPSSADVTGLRSPLPIFIDTGATLVDKSNLTSFSTAAANP